MQVATHGSQRANGIFLHAALPCISLLDLVSLNPVHIFDVVLRRRNLLLGFVARLHARLLRRAGIPTAIGGRWWRRFGSLLFGEGPLEQRELWRFGHAHPKEAI